MWPVRRSYPTLFVPATAVTSDQEQTFVILVRDGRAKWVTVKTGQTLGADIEVFGDLRVGDQVVSIASDSIRNGQKITAQPIKRSS